MASLKRPAAAAPASAPKAKQQRSEDPLAQKCDAIISVLIEANGHSQDTLQMLASSVKGCLMIPKEGRHEVQNSVIAMIGEVLSSIEVGHAEKLAAMKAKIADADAEKGRREAAAEAAAQTQKNKTEAVEAAQTATEEAREARLQAKCDLADATTAQKEGDANFLQAEGKKASGQAAVNDAFGPLKEGAAESVDAAIATLTDAAKVLGLEEQLIATAAVVLRKPVSERAAFDGVVIQQVEQQMHAGIAKLTEQINNGEADKAARAARVQECQTQLKDAETHRDACQEDLNASKVALKEAVSGRKAAEGRVQDLGPEMEEAAASAATAEAVLVACKADLATFQELVEGPPAVPEVDAAPTGEDEGVAAPEAAADAEAAGAAEA